MSVQICMVTLAEWASWSPTDLVHQLQTDWPELEIGESDTDEEGELLSLRLGGENVFVSHIPVPIPWPELEGPCETTRLWPDAAEELRSHGSHLIVSVLGESEGKEREHVRLLVQLTASILNCSPGALGVYWGNATLVISKKLFCGIAMAMDEENFPLLLCVDFRIGRNERGNSAGFTIGMQSLGHKEIEAPDAPERAEELFDRLYGLANYLISNGPVVQDGHTIGSDASERILVRFSRSEYGHEDLVMRLDYAGSGRKPWWKFW